MPNGEYVERWQYSQGYFDFVGTDDILKADEITAEVFETFFQKRGGKFLTVDYTIDIHFPR